MARKRAVNAVLIIGALPPPTHGMSMNTAVIADKLATILPVTTFSTASGQASPTRTRHLRRIYRVMKSNVIAIQRLSPGTALYLPFEHGLGRFYNLSNILCARLRRAPILLHHHSYSYITKRSRLTAMTIRIARPAVNIVLCDDMRSKFLELYPGTTCRIVSNACFMEAQVTAARNSAIRSKYLTVGLLSNLTLDKGVDTFLRIARHFEGEDQIRFVVAGPAVGTLASDLASSPVTWMGPIYGSEKSTFLSALDIFLFPSRYAVEAQPNVIFEAAAFGVLPITTDRGCLRNDVKSLNGYVFPEVEFEDEAVRLIGEILRGTTVRPARREDVAHRQSRLTSLADTALRELVYELFDLQPQT